MHAKVKDGAIVVKHIVPEDDMHEVVTEGSGDGEKWTVKDGRVCRVLCDPGGNDVPAPKPEAPASDLAPAVAQMADLILKQRETIEKLEARLGQVEAFQGHLIKTATVA